MSQPLPRVVWRIIDVNVNRAMEGARTVEEMARFGLNDARVTRALRRLRHDIGRSAAQLPGGRRARLSARDVAADVGRTTPPRRSRDWTALIGDNLQRTKESLRVLEECARVAAPRVAEQFQQLRFIVYDLERALDQRLAALRHPRRRGAARARRH